MIRFFQQDITFNLKNKLLVKKWINEVISSYSFFTGDINIIFCSDPYILDINNSYLHHNYYTDIITFDTSDGFSQDFEDKSRNKISGDLFISIDTVRENAKEYGQSFNEELHRVIIHGILHLVGEDDHTPEDIASMRAAENKALQALKTLIPLN